MISSFRGVAVNSTLTLQWHQLKELKEMEHILLDDETDQVIEVGSIVTTFRGEKCILVSWMPPRHEGSTGRVYVESSNGSRHEYFPSVIGCKIVERS